MVECPICSKNVKEVHINRHIDSGCAELVDVPSPPPTQVSTAPRASQATSFFHTPAKRLQSSQANKGAILQPNEDGDASATVKRPVHTVAAETDSDISRPLKRSKTSPVDKVAPLAERMRPKTLDEVCGQELVGPGGIVRNLIETDRVPSMVLWGGPGTGKTTIARLIAQTAGTRFVEINSTSTGVGEVKKLFTEAKNELALTGRKTIVFCDEIHRFSKSQQDVFLGPVEAGVITLIGATTENPSFKVINALLSRCRVFTLAKLSDEHIFTILRRALEAEPPSTADGRALIQSNDYHLLWYLSSFADGDARTALNLLSLALDLSSQADITLEKIKSSLTKTLVYDRAGDQHYDTISAFHKSVRGSDPDAALYYLARMLKSGEDPLYVARRMVVIASEDVGLADNTLLPLATAAYQAAEKIGMPECRINLAHCTVALCLAPKSTRSYRALSAAMSALDEPGVAGLPIPLHLRNAPTKLMKEMEYGKGYKYNPQYRDGKVVQEYMPEKLRGRKFLDETDMGDEVDRDLPGLAEDHGARRQISEERRAHRREPMELDDQNI
ncbi:DNA polymerase III, clamp loader complex, gamma/delta/delta subunit [Elsinoe ampelina]|uniref:DNA polymerase III, clamp loader complex, gamma/delta/delta subunit n=1 Tax=Elsinoe ampelina TaxID=302913 RepID=A0A6A6FXV7_9PEZI|nr:DNA polymerase III, clamp loader complex, gamma/delta/delta subunit [Elsinoe ampelina]